MKIVTTVLKLAICSTFYFLSHNAADIDYELFIIWRETTIDITPMSTNSHQMSPSHHFSAINTKVSIVE